MENYENTRKELARELAGLKKTYRNTNLATDNARYLASEIHTIETLLR